MSKTNKISKETILKIYDMREVKHINWTKVANEVGMGVGQASGVMVQLHKWLRGERTVSKSTKNSAYYDAALELKKQGVAPTDNGDVANNHYSKEELITIYQMRATEGKKFDFIAYKLGRSSGNVSAAFHRLEDYLNGYGKFHGGNPAYFEAAEAIKKGSGVTETQGTPPIELDKTAEPLEKLEKAFNDFTKVLGEVVDEEANRRTVAIRNELDRLNKENGELKAELSDLKEKAKHSNWINNIKSAWGK